MKGAATAPLHPTIGDHQGPVIAIDFQKIPTKKTLDEGGVIGHHMVHIAQRFSFSMSVLSPWKDALMKIFSSARNTFSVTALILLIPWISGWVVPDPLPTPEPPDMADARWKFEDECVTPTPPTPTTPPPATNTPPPNPTKPEDDPDDNIQVGSQRNKIDPPEGGIPSNSVVGILEENKYYIENLLDYFYITAVQDNLKPKIPSL